MDEGSQSHMYKRVLTSIVLATSVSMVGLGWAADKNTIPNPVQGGAKAANPQMLSLGEPVVEKVDGPQLSARIMANYTGRKYRLGPNDVLNVAVYDSPEFSQQDLLVQPDGNITLAPFGSVPVAGITIDDLQKELTDRLKYYLKQPQVTVKIAHTKPFQVYVTGAVLHPGAYEMVTDMMRMQMVNAANQGFQGLLVERKLPLLTNVLVGAGGLRYDADMEHVKVHNRFDDSTYEINLLDLLQGNNATQDLFLIAGDSIEVPKLPTPYAVSDEKYKSMLGSTIFQKEIPVRVVGYVNKPGLVMLDGAQSANLNSAIGEAGGYLASEASYAPTRVFVSRVDGNGHMTTREVDPRHEDMALRPNDLVYVPNKITPRIGHAFDYLARVVIPLGAIAASSNSWALLFNPTRYTVQSSQPRP
jgi:protein involved in polysaccharide export with SLBB domain